MAEPAEPISDYTHFIQLPLKFVGCWEWFPNTDTSYKIILNNLYLPLVMFVLLNLTVTLIVNLYTEWVDVMSSLDKLADGLPLIVSVAVVIYFALYRKELYELVAFMNENFKFRSARGLTNMTMKESYESAKKFAYGYTACTIFSVTMYVTMPMIVHLWTKHPLDNWVYMDITHTPYIAMTFLKHCLAQAFVGLALGQLGVFFAANSILLCGQLDLLCCSVRNARYTALLQSGVQYDTLLRQHMDIIDDERHNYIYSKTEMKDSGYHYDKKVASAFIDKRSQFGVFFAANSILLCGQLDLLCCSVRNARYTALLQSGVQYDTLLRQHMDIIDDERHNYIYSKTEMKDSGYHYDKKVASAFIDKRSQFDIYDPEFDAATTEALKACAHVSQVAAIYKDKFENFVSPLLALRVVQVTLYLCTLLYAASVKLELVTVEYLAAVALDIFVYCYFGNQIILQASRVSVAGYQGAWHTAGARPRRLLLNILLANKRPGTVRAGRFLRMDLHTFVGIIRTSFSYYTLLDKVNE